MNMQAPIIVYYLIFNVIFLSALVNTTPQSCEVNVAHSQTVYNLVYTTTYTLCWSLWDWFTCSSTVTRATSSVIYYTEQECCTGYDGDDCLPVCDDGCSENMECTDPNTCLCIDGWSGSDCSTAVCDDGCSEHMTCTQPNTCTCEDGWSGLDCSTAICDDVCGKHMACTQPNTCTCMDGWSGLDCSTAICNGGCSKNMVCTEPNTCTCIDGWSGSDCTTAICTDTCGINMECLLPNNCTCIEGWTGANCSTDVDECYTGIDSCEDFCKNSNGSYSCYCDDDSVLANDNIHCLRSVNAITALASSRVITLSWHPPSNYSNDGTLFGYNITSSSNETEHEAFVTNTSIVISSLKPFSDYVFCVSAWWLIQGQGPSECLDISTMQEEPDDAPTNIFLMGVDSTSLLAGWQLPTTPNGNITHCTLYINYTNGTEVFIVTVKSQFLLYLIEDLSPYQLVGVSISCTTLGGEGPLSVMIYNTTHESVPGSVHKLTALVTSNISVAIFWHPPLITNGIILHYHVVLHVYNGDVINEWTLEPQEDFQHNITGLQSFVPYEVEVSAFTIKGKGEFSKIIFFTDESVPRVVPLISKAKRTSPTTATIEWKPPSIKDAGGFLVDYNGLIFESSDKECTNRTKFMEINTTDTQILLHELKPFNVYCIYLACRTMKGLGNYSNMTSVDFSEHQTFHVYIMTSDDICLLWKYNTTKKLDEITVNIVNILRWTCGCSITTQYIIKRHFSNCQRNTLLYTAQIVGTVEANSTQLLDILIKEASCFTIQGTKLQVQVIYANTSSPELPLILNETCLELPSPSNVLRGSSETMYIGIAIGAALFFSSILLIITLWQCRLKRKRANVTTLNASNAYANYSKSGVFQEHETTLDASNVYANHSKSGAFLEHETTLDASNVYANYSKSGAFQECDNGFDSKVVDNESEYVDMGNHDSKVVEPEYMDMGDQNDHIYEEIQF